MNDESAKELIFSTMKDIAVTKQLIYKESLQLFDSFKKQIKEVAEELRAGCIEMKQDLDIEYKENGKFEVHLTIAGDLLIFSLHTNIFNFDENHFVHKLDYVKEDQHRAYCGMIRIYNFLADSFRFNRMNDVGYMIARVFINHERHFFVEGKRQLGFLYNDFANSQYTDETAKEIIQSAILYAMDFDLLVPPYDQVKELSVLQVLQQKGTMAIKTGKRMGFNFEADSDLVS